MNKKLSDLVSVIIPVYNGESYIQKCIESLLKQTYVNIEIIIIDDGSKDATANICQKLAAQDSRIIFLVQKNKGVSAARNKGLEVAKGEYVCFVDSDDYVDTSFVESHIKMIKSDPQIDISVCGFVDEKNDGTIIHQSEIEKSYVYSVSSFRQSDFVPYVCWQIMFRRIRLDCGNKKIRFETNISIKEDMLFLYELMMNSNKVIINPTVLYHSVHRDNSLSHKVLSKDGINQYLTCLDSFGKILTITKPNQELHKMIALAILKDIVKVKSNALSVGDLNDDQKKKIKDIKEKATKEVETHRYSIKENGIILCIKYFPKLYLKFAH